MKYEHVCALLDKYFDRTLGDAIPSDQFSHQPAVIANAWEMIVSQGQKGVVFADEVGLGKTYEALWTVYLYLLHRLGRRGSIRPIRVLMVVPPSLVEKWQDEVERFSGKISSLESTAEWDWPHCAHLLAQIEELVISDDSLMLKWKKRLFGANLEGIFLIRPSTLIKLKLDESPLSALAKQFKRITWDAVVFDEAHQYAKSSQRAQAAQALCEWAHQQDTKILLCTATPFQLDTSELNGLLSLVEPREPKRAAIECAIEDYNQSIIALREALETKRELGLAILRERANQSKQELEHLLRSYMLRTRRESHDTREYRATPVLPGDQFPWADRQVRDWIRSQAGDAKKRSFISTTLGMTVSSTESLVTHLESQATRDSDGRKALAAARKLPHPKFDALTGLVAHLLTDAAGALIDTQGGEVSATNHKCVIFASYTRTIEALKRSLVVSDAGVQLDERIRQAMQAQLWAVGLDDKKIKRQMERAIENAVASLTARYEFAQPDLVSIWKTEYEAQTSNEWWAERLIEWGAKKDLSQVEAQDSTRSIAGMLKRHLTLKLNEPSIQYQLTIMALQSSTDWAQRLSAAAQHEVECRLQEGLDRVVAQYYDNGSPVQSRAWLRLRLSRLVYSLVPHDAVEYITGKVEFATRQQTINAFNRDLYPLVLVCSSVGEEGIDLQKQCNRVVHYDLEWNPAKVEQREGRVDRRGRTSTQPVLVQTMKLADTYDERILKRCENRRIWMDLFLCKSWKEENAHADSDTVDVSDIRVAEHDSLSWLRDYRLDLQPKPIH